MRCDYVLCYPRDRSFNTCGLVFRPSKSSTLKLICDPVVRRFNAQFLSNIWPLFLMGEFALMMRFRIRQPTITPDLSFLALVTYLITQCWMMVMFWHCDTLCSFSKAGAKLLRILRWDGEEEGRDAAVCIHQYFKVDVWLGTDEALPPRKHCNVVRLVVRTLTS